MKTPIFVRPLSEDEREGLQKGLRSKDTFTLRRSQMLLASSRGERAPRIALNLGCASQTVRDSIHDFNERGMDALDAKSSRPKRIREAFEHKSAEGLREMLHHSPREFGYHTSLWTLGMVAEAAFEEGLTKERVSGETVRATLSRLLGVRWMRAKRWITSPDPLYERKKAARPTDGSRRGRPRVGGRLRGRMLVEPGGASHPQCLEP
jgi:transposase